MISKHNRLQTLDVRHQPYPSTATDCQPPRDYRQMIRNASGVPRITLHVFTSIVCGLLFIVFLSSALAQKPTTKIDIKAKDIRGSDLTKEECLRRIHGIHLSKDLRGAQLDEVDISGANLASADLSEANLKKSILKGTKLNRANLTKANLENAILYQADLRNAKLTNANLKNANLIKANLRNASMVGANLGNAVLIDSDLSGANLTGANMEGAKTNGAVFSGTIMSDGQIHP